MRAGILYNLNILINKDQVIHDIPLGGGLTIPNTGAIIIMLLISIIIVTIDYIKYGDFHAHYSFKSNRNYDQTSD
jgi:hypothetical protein